MKYSEVDWSKFDDKPEEETYNDWVKVRKAHRAPVTQTAIRRIAPHINKLFQSGVDADEAFSIAAENGWRGIKYQWVQNAIHQDMQGMSDNVVSIGGRKTKDIGLIEELSDGSWAD